MSQKIEDVAFALQSAMPGLVSPEAWPWRMLAGAAIEAMREPTEAMVAAFDESAIRIGGIADSGAAEPDIYDPKLVWQAGIDEALK